MMWARFSAARGQLGLTFQQDAEGKSEVGHGTNAAFPPLRILWNNAVVGFDADESLDRHLGTSWI
jgi:hypothetical protein